MSQRAGYWAPYRGTIDTREIKALLVVAGNGGQFADARSWLTERFPAATLRYVAHAGQVRGMHGPMRGGAKIFCIEIGTTYERRDRDELRENLQFCGIPVITDLVELREEVTHMEQEKQEQQENPEPGNGEGGAAPEPENPEGGDGGSGDGNGGGASPAE